MKKHLYFALIALIVLFSLTACSASQKEVTVATADLAKQLATETVTNDTLVAPALADILSSTYFVEMDKIEDSAIYLGSATTSCEVAVIKCKDSSYVTEVAELFKTRAKNQKELYASYNAPESKKLDAAIITTAGNYAVLCVSDDISKAKEILGDAGFNVK